MTDGAVRIATADGALTAVVARAGDQQPTLDGEHADRRLVTVGGGRARLEAIETAEPRAASPDARRAIPVLVLPGPATRAGARSLEVVVEGWRFEVEVEPERRAALRGRATKAGAAAARDGRLELRAVIPGRVLAVAVNAGDEVGAGDRLLVVEAMKMQNEIRAPRAGTVTQVAVGAGDTIELRDLLVVLE